MPCGNLTGSGTSRPAGSREPVIQQSSMLTYWYPAAFMPELTIVSAVCWTSCSLTLQPKAFQSFQPIGGVRARPLFSATAGAAGRTRTDTEKTDAQKSRSTGRDRLTRPMGYRSQTSLSYFLQAMKYYGWTTVNIQVCGSVSGDAHNDSHADHGAARSAAAGRRGHHRGPRGPRARATRTAGCGVQRRRPGDAARRLDHRR